MSDASPGRDSHGKVIRPWDDIPDEKDAAPHPWRQVAIISVVAIALFVGVRSLPVGGHLSHMDFRMAGKGVLEFCDPANPEFIPVVQVRSPVVLTLQADRPPTLNQMTNFILTMKTASGKPIAPEDLLVSHTRKLHLMVVDPTLSDYQHIHPEPGKHPGEWTFAMAPERPGLYRVFADFTPAATARSLYASVDFSVPGIVAIVARSPNTTWQTAGFNFELVVPPEIHAGKQVDMRLRIESQGTIKKRVPLGTVMGAFAHLVAFDEARSGFAHLHPQEVDLSKPPDAFHPELTFKITIPQAGRYVIWGQVNIDGAIISVPFWLDVLR
ncbi:MAG: hypothetical protein ABI273_06505 [Lacunisphaera sp.]